MPPSDLAAEDVALRLSALVDGGWAAAAFVVLGGSGAVGDDGRPVARNAEEQAAVDVLVAAGLGDLSAAVDGGMLSMAVEGTRSSIRQMAAAVAGDTAGAGWAAQDDETLLAQGKASAMAGTVLARMAVPTLEGLAARFDGDGVFLDVGVGVGELSAAFCDALPRARAIGLDVMPRVLELARRNVDERGLAERVDLRLTGVQDLTDEAIADLAWLPAPFIPSSVFDDALATLHRALRPGGWLVVAAGRLDGDDELAVAVTRWKTVLAGGTPLRAADVADRLAAAGFGPVTELPMPPTAPAMYAARR